MNRIITETISGTKKKRVYCLCNNRAMSDPIRAARLLNSNKEEDKKLLEKMESTLMYTEAKENE